MAHATHRVEGVAKLLTDRELEIYERRSVDGRPVLSEEKRARYVARWNNEPAPAAEPRPARSLPVLSSCPHRSAAPVGEEQCRTCGGNVRVKVYGCEVFGTCTLGKKAGAHAVCQGCKVRPAPDVKAVAATAAAPDFTPAVRRPRVLLVSHDLTRSGAPRILLDAGTRLRGFDLSVHALAGGPLVAEWDRAGLPPTVGPMPDPSGYDAVVASTLLAAPAVAACRATGVPCVWLIQEAAPGWCGTEAVVRGLIDYPAAVVFPCEEVAARYPVGPYRARVVPTVIPAVPALDRGRCRAGLGYADDEFVVVGLGRDEPRKGQADVRAAVAGLAGVRWVPVADDPDPHRYLAAADLYVCSSRSESYSLALQEAKAHGLPVVTTRVDGYAGLLRDGVDAAFYEPGDVATLRGHIVRCRADRAWLRGYGPPDAPRHEDTVAAYEAIVRAACRSSPPGPAAARPAQPLHVVYHVAGMGPHWRGIVTEQLSQLRAAGLTHVLGTHVGEGLAWLQAEARRLSVDLTVCHSSPDLTEYERPGILLVERLAAGGDTPVLYLHAKGVSRPLAETHWHDWRRLMMWELVGGWRKCLAALESGGYDAAGVNWWFSERDRAKTHFSGNFWMASAAWLRRLPPFADYYRDRFSCERWVGAVPGCRALSLACHDARFWSADAPLLGRLVAARRAAPGVGADP